MKANIDMFVQKLNSSGQFVWALQTEARGTNESVIKPRAIKVDPTGENIVVAGGFTGTVNFNYSISNEDVPGADHLFWGTNSAKIDSVGPSPTGAGTVSFPITAGQTLVIGVSSDDDQLGVLSATISNFSISVPVPVSGSPLSVSNEQAARVLTWTTFKEANNKGFELQRSADATNFSTIGFVPSYAKDGHSNTSLKYTFSDMEAATPVMYYRYKQIDHDGHQSYSNVVLVKDAAVSLNTGLKVFPNPLMKTQLLSLNNTLEGTLLLFNSAGILVHKEFAGKQAKLKLPAHVAPGTYFTVLQTSNAQQSATLVVQ
ncbi:MAG: T9SS type A sorting domain-containing protein [Chryseobacterium sp.]|nr:MAG: T9SS type A sorting domain-containing protein [Chryseobacterium sp.]